MSGTFEDIHGNIYPVSRVVMITPDKAERDMTKLPRHQVFLDFRDSAVHTSNIDQIIALLHPPVPAAPGWTLLSFWYDPGASDPEAEPHIQVRPIIAWRLDGPNGHHAITADEDYGRNGLRWRDAIEDVSGKVIDAFQSTYPTRADWTAWMKSERDSELAAKAQGGDQ